jgi:hypothetical protein
MISIHHGNRLIVAVTSALLLAACGQQTPPPPPPPKPAPTAPAPTPMPPPAVAPAATPAPTTAGTTFTSVDLGKGVNASGNELSGPAASVFGPKDTIYALVRTNASSAALATIAARWMFAGGTLVNDANRQVAATGNSVTEFHIAKPDGWPVGHYTVTISIDGKPVGGKDFDVR